MREEGTVRMVARVMGVKGILNRRRDRGEATEIYSVGPSFREVDYRDHGHYTRTSMFAKAVPI